MNTNEKLVDLGEVSKATQSGGFQVNDIGTALKQRTPAAV